jgi:hypothetical protein
MTMPRQGARQGFVHIQRRRPIVPLIQEIHGECSYGGYRTGTTLLYRFMDRCSLNEYLLHVAPPAKH